MTYQNLLDQLKNLTVEQLAMDVTVYISGFNEYYPLVKDYPFNFSEKDDVLDANTPYLVV